MTPENDEKRDRREKRLDRIVARYLEARRLGEDPDREAILARHPDLARELAEFFESDRDFRSVHDLREVASANLAPLPVGDRFGDYRILEEIARGGMGIVYRAHHEDLDREVALKVILAGPLASSAELERFLVETRAAAQLDHPRIVSVLDAGEVDGRRYYTMRLVEGGNLGGETERYVRRPRDAAVLIEQVARAVQHAHDRGVIHRDLKPANILIDADGTPHVSDFGLAKLVDSDGSLTATGAVLGTPDYMSPELAAGDRAVVTGSTDVYSLGAILYELATGRRPFRGATPFDTLDQVKRREPDRPRSSNPNVDVDLETICLRCLEKTPRRRYRTAGLLADDLRRYLDGVPIVARRVGHLERAWKWSRRRPALSSLIAILFLVLSLLVAGGIWHNVALRRALLETREREATGRRYLYGAEMSLAQQAWEKGRVPRAYTLLLKQIPRDGEEDLRGFEWHHLWRIARGQVTRYLASTETLAAAFSPRGRLLVTGDEFGTIRLVEVATRRDLAAIEAHPNEVLCLDVSPSGTLLASGHGTRRTRAEPGVVRLFPLDGGSAPLGLEGHEDSVLDVAFSPGGEMLASGGRDGKVLLWSAPDGERLHEFSTSAPVGALSWSTDGRELAAAAADGSRKLLTFDVAGRALRRTVICRGGGVILALRQTADGRLLAGGAEGEVARVWNGATGEEEAVLRAHSLPVTTLALSPDGSRVVTGAKTPEAAAQLYSWRLDGAPFPEPVVKLSPSTWWIHAVRFSPDGRLVAAAASHHVWFWRPAMLESPSRRKPPTRPRSVAFSPRGGLLAVGDGDGIISFSIPGAPEPSVLQGHAQTVYGLSFSHDGRTLASISSDKTAILWDAEKRRLVARLTGHLGTPRAVAFDPADRWLAVASYRMVKVWDVREHHEVAVLSAHEDRVQGAVFSADGRRLITGSIDHTVKVWDTAGWTLASVLETPRERVFSVALSPDGDVIAAGGGLGTIFLWELATGRPLPSITGHSGAVVDLVFSARGPELISIGEDRSMSFWDGATWNERVTFELGFLPEDIALSEDGRRLVAAGEDSLVSWVATDAESRLADPLDAKFSAAVERSYPLPAPVSPAEKTAPPAEHPDWSLIEPPGAGAPGCQAAVWGDHDGDGDPDVYLVFNGVNRLLRNDGDGRFAEATPPVLADTGDGRTACFGDLDGDGDLDLYLVNSDRANRLFLGDGRGGFEDATSGPLGDEAPGRAAAWIDHDGDGDLDLYLVRTGTRNLLLRNDGERGFVDATPPLLEGRTVGFSNATWGDADGDGDPDLFLANHGKDRNWLMENRGDGDFRDATPPALESPGLAARDVSWGDADGDGDLDLYVTVDWDRNALYRNDGAAGFTDVTTGVLRGTGRESMTARWADHDLDGDLDIFLVDNYEGGSQLLRNDGGGRFSDITPFRRLGSLTDAGWADIDGDGDLDLLVTEFDGRTRILRNEQSTGHHWLQVRLEGSRSNRSGVGAHVRVVAAGRTQVREISSAPGNHGFVAHFGLGKEQVAGTVEVRWPSGIVQTLRDVRVDRLVTITEPAGTREPARRR